MDQQIKLDKFDRAILRALQRNARASLQEVSEEVGLTTSPCWTRIKRLEESGVIEGYTVKVNAEKIGRPEQLIVHTGKVLQGCAWKLAEEAMEPEEDELPVSLDPTPDRPSPVTQNEMDAGSIDLF